MVDLTITAASVIPADSPPPQNEFREGTAGGTITRGMPVYVNSSSQFIAAQATSAAAAAIVGVALQDVATGQKLIVQTAGKLAIGATVAVGTLYVLSAAAAGGIAPDADLTTGNYFSPIGFGISTSQIQLCIANTGAQHA